MTPSEKAKALRKAIPPDGLFANKSWRIAPDPLRIQEDLYNQILELGPRLYAFYKACNLLYRQSVEGKQPSWIHRYLDAGKSPSIIQLAREKCWKNDLPCVIRPDILVTEDGFSITELDSVPGGIGLTGWLQWAYAQIASHGTPNTESMLNGFITALKAESQKLKNHTDHIAIVISKEADVYRPEMEWLAAKNHELQATSLRLSVCKPEELQYRPDGVFLHNEKVDVIYRFFELFDLPNIANVEKMSAAAREGQIRITPPFKPQLEEKLLFALFWFPRLAEFWHRELGERYFRDLKKLIPFTWLLDPTPLPPHAVIPQLEINDWHQLSVFSQKERDLILKISGFSELAWGSRGVFLGSDMSSDQWGEVVSKALSEFEKHPYILQRFIKTQLIEHTWYDFEKESLVPMKGRLRFCPYYFIENDKPALGGILATLCPADKKFIHGMEDAIVTLAINDRS